ncbi:MAG: DNA polymerase III subunit delta' [Methylococcales bacterium]|nr:DNA polymerase III subunit delta' [Methylococcales bacterium]
MRYEEIFPWQQPSWALFNQYLLQNRVPQALLINGVKGLGKQQLARGFAKALLCPQRLPSGQSCGQCDRCKLFKAQTHPDFISLSPKEEANVIGIDRIRELIIKLSLKPQFEAYRVVLVAPADKLNKAAANAFLKCLEEPNERTCIILLTETLSKLPATILSRCQKMSLLKPSNDVANRWLIEQQVSEHRALLLNLAQGAPLLAKDYAETNILPLRQQCFSDWLNVATTQANPIEIAEKWVKQSSPLIIFWLIAWVADLIKCFYQSKEINLYNPDLQQNLQKLISQLNVRNLYHFYDKLLQSQKRLDSQINKQLMFEELLILWAQLNQGN